MGNTSSELDLQRTNCVRIDTKQIYTNESNDTLATPSDISYTSSPMTPITPNTPMITPTPVSRFPNIRVTKLTQRVISDRIAETAATFWCNIERCTMKDRLEIACSIFFGMMESDAEINRIVQSKYKLKSDLETVALKTLDMIGFIIRAKYSNNNNIQTMLYKLGTAHTAMGVKFKYYKIMLNNMNQTLKSYFPIQYTHSCAFAISEIFTYATQLMTGCDLRIRSKLTDMSCMNSLRNCIKNEIAREYLFRYLHQKYCDEVVVFLYLLGLFHNSINSKEKYIIAQQIKDLCIDADGMFAVNISFDQRQNSLLKFTEFNKLIKCVNNNVKMESDFFGDIEDELCRLIMQSHWKQFTYHMKRILFTT